jgi:hypothetical protein
MSAMPRWRRRRSVGSGALTVLGAMLVALGLVQLWATDTFFDADRFAGTAVTALERDAVRAELSRILVDQTIAYRQDLITVRPLLETVANSVIASPPFRRLFVTAVSDLHRSLFTTEQPTLLLNLSDAALVLIGGLRAFDPTLAERVPANVQAGLVSFGDRTWAQDLAAFAAGLRSLAWIALVVGLTALVAAVALSPSRRRALTSLGAALTVAALLLNLALQLGRNALVTTIETAGTAAAVGAVFDTFASPLAGWLWVVGFIGVGIAAAATAATNAEQQRDWLLRSAQRLVRPPTTRGRRALYALAALMLGLLVMTQPDTMLHFAARVVGALLLYFAGAELLRLSGLLARPAARRTADGDRRPPLPARLLAGGAVAGLLVLATLAFWLSRDALRGDTVAEAEEIAHIKECNGHAQLCDRRLNTVVFAGTHNAMSAAREPGWYFASHDGGIPAQLKAGIRALLIDAHYGFAGSDGVSTDLSNSAVRAKVEATLDPEMIAAAQRILGRRTGVPRGAKAEVFLCHGFCELGVTPLDRTLGQVRDFLKEHPHEVVILFFEDYVTPADMEASFMRSRLIDYVYTYRPDEGFPTLRTMIERGERVLVLSENVGDQPHPDWYHDGFALAQETPFSFKAATDLSCSPNRGRPDSPLFQLNHWLEKLTPSPADAAAINAYPLLLARARQCQKERGHLPNIVAVNFYGSGDVIAVVDTLNGVAPERKLAK